MRGENGMFVESTGEIEREREWFQRALALEPVPSTLKALDRSEFPTSGLIWENQIRTCTDKSII